MLLVMNLDSGSVGVQFEGLGVWLEVEQEWFTLMLSHRCETSMIHS